TEAGWLRRTTKARPRGVKKREPRSGTEGANPRWLQRFVRPRHFCCTIFPSTTTNVDSYGSDGQHIPSSAAERLPVTMIVRFVMSTSSASLSPLPPKSMCMTLLGDELKHTNNSRRQ